MNRGFKNKEANFYFIILCRAGHATTSSLLAHKLTCCVARQWAGLSLQLDKYGAAVPSTVRAQLRMKGGVIDFHHVCPISMSRVKMGGGMILTPLSTTFPDEAMTRK